MGIASEMELSLRHEYEGAALGDERRTKRLCRMAAVAAEHPDASLPALFPEPADREASYRFFRNDHITPQALLAPHRQKTAQRAVRAGPVLVVHDTSEFNFGHHPRQGLGTIGRGTTYGFYGHVSLVLERQDHRLPLGVVAVRTHHRGPPRPPTDPAPPKPSPRQRKHAPDNEHRRWLAAVEESAAVLADCPDVLHVMDREADDYALFEAMCARGHRFLIRACHDRCTVHQGHTRTLWQALAEAPILPGTRPLVVSRRDANPLPSYRKQFPPRRARRATLRICATTVVLKRPDYRPHHTLTVNVVRVFEPRPPPNEPALDWVLLTTEPIETAAQVWALVDAYRGRWVIEEFFKALKTGCAYEARQFETEVTLLRALAFFLPLAWWLLVLRTVGRAAPRRPATALLSPLQLRCLRAALRHGTRHLPRAPTVRDVLLGIARLGGHIPQNGEPGWIVLLRGLEKLLYMVEGYRLAGGKM